VFAHPHADVDTLTTKIRSRLGSVSTQTVYDVLRVLEDTELIRRIEPAGSPARFEPPARARQQLHVDGSMTFEYTGDQAVYAPNSDDRSFSDLTGPVDDSWEADGPMVRSAYELHAQDDDFGQAGTLVRDVWNDAQRAEGVANVTGHILGGVKGQVLERAFQYWKNVDADTGKLIETNVRAAHDA
jgi:catalase